MTGVLYTMTGGQCLLTGVQCLSVILRSECDEGSNL